MMDSLLDALPALFGGVVTTALWLLVVNWLLSKTRLVKERGADRESGRGKMAHKHRCLGCGGVIEGEFDCEYAANHGGAKEPRYVDDCVMKGKVTLADCCDSLSLMYFATMCFDNDPTIAQRAHRAFVQLVGRSSRTSDGG